jgi:hypothetical protein
VSPLESLSKSQKYQLVLEDIALAAAILAYEEGAPSPPAIPYVPGRIRPSNVTDLIEPGQEHVACARRALKGPGYAYKAG